MKQHEKKFRTYFGIILGSFFCSAFSLSFIPVLSRLDDQLSTTWGYAIALLFWIGLIVGCIMIGVMNAKMRRARAKVYSAYKMKRPKRPGMFMFSKEPLHLVIYFVIVSGFIISVADLIRTFVPTRIMFPVISVTYFAIVIHGIIDGKNFRIYQKIKVEG